MFTAEAVLQDEGAALSSVENGEAVGIPSLGGVLRGLAAALAQAWTSNPAYRRVSQAYLAAGGAASRMVDDLESKDRDWHDVERARFAVNALTSALAPTNTLPGSPAARQRSSAPSTPPVAACCGDWGTWSMTSGTTAACPRRPTARLSRWAGTWP